MNSYLINQYEYMDVCFGKLVFLLTYKTSGNVLLYKKIRIFAFGRSRPERVDVVCFFSDKRTFTDVCFCIQTSQL